MINRRTKPRRRWIVAVAVLAMVAVLLGGGIAWVTGRADRTSEDAALEQGMAARARGDLSAALRAFKTAAQAAPDNGDVRRLLGQAHMALGEAAAAEQVLARALALGAEPRIVEPTLVSALLSQAKYQELIDRPVLDSLSVEARATTLAARGHAHVALGESGAARTRYREALESGPHNPDALLGLALLAEKDDKRDLARQQLGTLLEHSPDFAMGWLLLGDLENKAGNRQAARDAYARVIALPGNAVAEQAARVGRAELNLADKEYEAAREELNILVAKGRKSPGISLALGQVAVLTGDIATANRIADEVLAEFPTLPAAWYFGGMLAYLQGNFESSESLLSKFDVHNPGSIRTSIMLARISMSRGEIADARETLRAAARTHPNDAQLQTVYARMMLAGGQTGEAIEALEKRLELEPESLSARLELGSALAFAGRADDGIKAIESAVESNPKDAGAVVVLFTQLIRTGKVDEALELARRLNAQHPGNVSILSMLGLAQFAAGEHTAARDSLDKALALKPDSLVANRALLELARSEGNTEEARVIRDRILKAYPKDLASLRQLASEQFQADDFAAAMATYEQILASHPAHLATLLDLGTLQGRTGKADDALKTLESTLQLYPGSEPARLALAAQYRLLGRRDDAVRTLKPVASTKSNDPALLANAGSVFLAAGDIESATVLLRRLVEQQPDAAEAHYLLAGALAAAGDQEAAESELTTANSLDPEHLPTQIGRIARFINTGRLDEAAKLQATLESKHPSNPEVVLKAGELAYAQGRHDDAVAKFDELHALVGTSATLKRLAIAQGQAGDPQQMIATLQGWLDAHPNDVDVMNALAESYSYIDDVAGATGQYQRILDVQPQHVLALNNLALLYHENGQQGALQLAAQAYKLAPGHPAILDTYGWLLVESDLHEQGVELLGRAVELAPKSTDVRFHYAKGLLKLGRLEQGRAQLKMLSAITGEFPEREEIEAILRQQDLAGMK